MIWEPGTVNIDVTASKRSTAEAIARREAAAMMELPEEKVVVTLISVRPYNKSLGQNVTVWNFDFGVTEKHDDETL